MLYFPWLNEEHYLKSTAASFRVHFQQVNNVVLRNEALFSLNAEELNEPTKIFNKMVLQMMVGIM